MRRQKKTVTRRDFISRATKFAAIAGMSAAAKPFFIDYLIKNTVASGDPDLPPFSLVGSDRGGLPVTSIAYRNTLMDEITPPVEDISFYLPNSQPNAFHTVQNGRDLFLPPQFATMPSSMLQNVSTWMGMSGGPGGHPPVSTSMLCSNGGSTSTLNIDLAQKNSEFGNRPILHGVELSNNGQTLSNNAGESPLFDPVRVQLIDDTITAGDLAQTLSPVELEQMDENELDILKLALNWIANLFGNNSVNTKGINSAVTAVEAGTELFSVNVGDLITFDEGMREAYKFDEYVETIPNPPPNWRPVNLGLLFAYAEVLFKHNITTQVLFPFNTQDWHRVPQSGNELDPLFKLQDHFARKFKVFIERLSSIQDPRVGSGETSIGENLLLMITSVQGRAIRNDGGWGDDNCLFSWLFHSSTTGRRMHPGNWGDINFEGKYVGVDKDGNSLPAGTATHPVSFLHTLYHALRIDKNLNANHKKIDPAVLET